MSTGKIISESVPRLHAVTLVRSGIGRPYWQKRTLQALGFTKLQQTIVHKNTASINGMLASVKELIKVQPVVFRTDFENSPNGKNFLAHNGHYFIDPKEWPMELICDEPGTATNVSD